MNHWSKWLALGVLMASFAHAETPAWKAVDEAKLTVAQKAKVERAVQARNEAMGAMMGEVQKGMKAGGPAATIGVCSERAPTIIAQVAKTRGVKMGRTSHRLRNPKNIAPAWAEAAVKSIRREPLHVAGPNGAVGLLTPIPTAPPCVSCHGEIKALDETVRTALAKRYPTDAATGFAVGDIRGWFWVEVE